jgi:hypothetical protein
MITSCGTWNIYKLNEKKYGVMNLRSDCWSFFCQAMLSHERLAQQWRIKYEQYIWESQVERANTHAFENSFVTFFDFFQWFPLVCENLLITFNTPWIVLSHVYIYKLQLSSLTFIKKSIKSLRTSNYEKTNLTSLPSKCN